MHSYYDGKTVIYLLDRCIYNINNEENFNLFQIDATLANVHNAFEKVCTKKNTALNEDYEGEGTTVEDS